MKTITALSVALLLAAGCRRSDVRTVTVSIPGLSPSNKVAVVQALARYEGIRKGSYVFDMEAKTLTLEYDSLRLAQSNIRYAIDEKGVKVAFPEKKDDRAGY